jgi:hypothetical protein
MTAREVFCDVDVCDVDLYTILRDDSRVIADRLFRKKEAIAHSFGEQWLDGIDNDQTITVLSSSTKLGRRAAAVL